MSQPPHQDWDEHDVREPSSRHRFEDDILGLRGVTEHDESLADDVLSPAHEGEMFRPRRRRRRNPILRLVALMAAAALVLTAAVFAVPSVRDLLPDLSAEAETGQDYSGGGSGEVVIEIPAGAGGGEIAQILVAQDVVGSSSAFMAALQAEPRSSSIQPGTYRMAMQMSSQAAVARLLDGNFREINGVTVREGLWVAETFEVLAEETGNAVEDYEAVDPQALDLPEAAQGELEGFLYPSTYEFGPDDTPEEQLRAMVALGKQKYAEIGVPEDQLRDVIIKASIVQGEGLFAEDLPKIARVMENRLEGASETNGMMQMDSTVHFIYQERGLAGTTEEQRANDSPYNTYLHPGLPPGPINSPGEVAIRAAVDPAEGEWLYFVTVDPSTGQTNFAESYEEHLQNQQIFLEWCEENPDQC